MRVSLLNSIKENKKRSFFNLHLEINFITLAHDFG